MYLQNIWKEFIIVGFQSIPCHNGIIESCIALNPLIEQSAEHFVHSILGCYALKVTTSEIYAYDGIKMNYMGDQNVWFHEGIDGVKVSAVDLQKASGYPDIFHKSPWVYKEGKLPVLEYLSNQDDSMPDHLKN